MANETSVHVRNGNLPGEAGNVETIHFILEKLEEIADTGKAMRAELDEIKAGTGTLTAEQQQLQVTLERQQGDYEKLQRWARYQDGLKSAGNKFYTPLDGRKPGSDPRRTAFALNCMDHIHAARTNNQEHGRFDPEGWKRQQTEGTNAYGAYLVVPEQLEMITELQENYGLALQVCRVLRMGKQELRMPTLTARPPVYWPDEGVAPGETGPLTQYGVPTSAGSGITESRTEFGQPKMIAKRMMLIDTITSDIDEDSAPMLSDYLPDVVALSFTKEIDRVVFAGNTAASPVADPFMGMLYDTNVSKFTLAGTSSAGLTYEDLLELIDTPSPFALTNARFIHSTSINLLLRKMRDVVNGRPLWTEMSQGDPNTLFGFPISRSEVMPTQSDSTTADTGFMLFGDFRFWAVGLRNDFALDFSREVDFKRGNVVMRGMQRVSSALLIGSAIARIQTHA